MFTLLDGINSYTDVIFDSVAETVTCLLLSKPLDSMKECNVILSYGANCNMALSTFNTMSSGSGNTFIETPPLRFIEGIDRYCIKIIARSQNLNFNIISEDIINLQRPIFLNSKAH